MTDHADSALADRIGELEDALIREQSQNAALTGILAAKTEVADAAETLVHVMADVGFEPLENADLSASRGAISEALQRVAHLVDPNRFKSVPGEEPPPVDLAEWYEQLVDAAADGNADSFEAEADRIRAFVLADLHAQASDEEDRILDVLAHCAWGPSWPIPERQDA